MDNMDVWHEKNLLEPSFPFRLFFSENIEFPPHWHEEIELIYVIEGTLQVGLNNEVFSLKPKDILVIGAREIHHFLQQTKWSKSIFIQFGLALFDSFSMMIGDRWFSSFFIGHAEEGLHIGEYSVHHALESQILSIAEEYKNREEGYQMALKARLYDLMVILLRRLPMEEYSPERRQKQLQKLERLEKVFQYVEQNYERNISLREISRVANFSVYHFTRFFKEATGITFGQFLTSYRLRKAEQYLRDTEDLVVEVALKAGFNSIKTFNRVFKQHKGCAPSVYRKGKI